MASKSYLVVGGDVGGTNSRLKLYSIPSSGKIVLTEGQRPPGKEVYGNWYENGKFKTFADILNTFIKAALKEVGDGYTVADIVAACIAVAGPVGDNTVTLTNRGWVLNGDKLAAEVGIRRILLVNDFVALGYGLLTVDTSSASKEVVVLQKGEPKKKAPIACIGAGTGLGQVYLTVDNGHYVAYPSEGGHAEFPPRNDLEFELLKYLKQKFEAKHRVSVERVISGIGLANVYEFLAQAYPDQVDQAVHKEFVEAGDYKGRVVAMAANKGGPGTLAAMAMDIFISAYGSEAGVAGLKWMPFGGLFIAGGLTPKNINRIKPDASGSSLFLDAFFDKGRVSPFLKRIPLYAVLVEDLGERGAHWVATKLLLDVLGHKHTGAESARGCVWSEVLCNHATVLALSLALVTTTSLLVLKSIKK